MAQLLFAEAEGSEYSALMEFRAGTWEPRPQAPSSFDDLDSKSQFYTFSFSPMSNHGTGERLRSLAVAWRKWPGPAAMPKAIWTSSERGSTRSFYIENEFLIDRYREKFMKLILFSFAKIFRRGCFYICFSPAFHLVWYCIRFQKKATAVSRFELTMNSGIVISLSMTLYLLPEKYD